MARPVGVTIIAILEFLGAGVFIAIGLFCLLGMSFLASLLSQMSQTRDLGGAVFTALTGLGAVFAVGFFILAAIVMLIAWGMWKLKNWARIITIILCGVGILFGIFGLLWALLHFNLFVIMVGGIRLAINLLIVWYLLQPNVKRAFGA